MTGHEIHVYVDETGDRGGGETSSPIFGMAAVLVTGAGAQALRAAVGRLRADFRVPDGKVMSWKEHVKTHDRRRRAADVLRSVDGLRVCYVYAVKAELRAGSYRDDPQRFYNYVAYTTYKAVLWAARDWVGATGRVWTRFGHVRHHDHRTTREYIQDQARRDPKVPFEMEQGLRWVSADRYVESQAADLYGGFLKAALWPGGEFSYVEPTYLLRIWPQLRGSERCAVPLGIMPMPDPALLTGRRWFPCRRCPARSGLPRSLQGPIH